MNILNKTTVVTSTVFADILRKSIIKLNGDAGLNEDHQKSISSAATIFSNLEQDSVLEFVSGSSLFAEVLKVATACTTDVTTENKEEFLPKLISEATSIYTPELTGLIEDVAEAFASKIKEGRANLTSMKEVAKSLTTEINTIFATKCNLDPIIVKVEGAKVAKYDFPMCTYEMLAHVGSKYELYSAIEDVTVGTAKLTQEQKYSVTNGKYLNKALVDVTPVALQLNDAAKQTILTKICETNPEYNKDNVNTLLNLINSDTQITHVLKEAGKHLNNVINPNEAFFFFINFIKDNGPILTKVEETVLKQGVDIKCITPNVKILSAIMEIGAYFVYQHRETTFANTLMFANGCINSDVSDKAAEAKITNEDVAKHCTTLMKDIPFGKSGISLQKVIDNKSRVEVMFKQAEAIDLSYVETAKNKILKTAIISVLTNHFKNTYNKDYHDEIVDSADRIIRYSLPVQDIIYGTIIDKLHKNSVTELMYNELGKAYVTLLSENKEVTEDMVTAAGVNTYVGLISNFMYKFFVVKKQIAEKQI